MSRTNYSKFQTEQMNNSRDTENYIVYVVLDTFRFDIGSNRQFNITKHSAKLFQCDYERFNCCRTSEMS